MSKDQRHITDEELDEVLTEVLLAPRGKARKENKTPTREELKRRYTMERVVPEPENGSKTI